VTAAGRPPAVDAVSYPRKSGIPQAVSGTGAELQARFPPRPAAASWPATEATRQQVLARLLAPPFTLDHPFSQQSRRLGLVTVLNWLEAQPGGSWQDRWQASGAEDRADWRDLVAAWKAGRAGPAPVSSAKPPPHIGPGLLVLICADVIRPGSGWLLRCPSAPRNLAAEMARTRDDASSAACISSWAPRRATSSKISGSGRPSANSSSMWPRIRSVGDTRSGTGVGPSLR